MFDLTERNLIQLIKSARKSQVVELKQGLIQALGFRVQGSGSGDLDILPTLGIPRMAFSKLF